jgi:16S rRNA (uracil1498-N3)-methyltransferase
VAYLVEVKSVTKKDAIATIIEERKIQALPKPHIHLALSIPRYNVMDSTIERATEMGVSSILPFVSQYSFIRKEKELPAGKAERWQKIVVSATQQCGRGELMKIHDVTNWQSMLKTINPNAQNWCLFAYEGQSIKPIADEIKSLREQFVSLSGSGPENIWIIVGSEGGFSRAEAEEMHKLGLHPVTLGSQILRVETACLTLVAILKYEFGQMK